MYIFIGSSKLGFATGILFLILQLWPDVFMWPFRGIIWLVLESFIQSSRTPLLLRLASRIRRERAGVSDAQLVIALLAPGLLAAASWHLTKRIQRQGWQRFLHAVFTPAWQRDAEVRRQHAVSSVARDKRGKAVNDALHKLPVERFLTTDDLLRMTVEKLRERLVVRRIALPRGASKEQMVSLLQASSTETTCAICCEDFEANDILRRLHCDHVFHRECNDTWCWTSIDRSRPVSCAMCKMPLYKPE